MRHGGGGGDGGGDGGSLTSGGRRECRGGRSTSIGARRCSVDQRALRQRRATHVLSRHDHVAQALRLGGPDLVELQMTQLERSLATLGHCARKADREQLLNSVERRRRVPPVAADLIVRGLPERFTCMLQESSSYQSAPSRLSEEAAGILVGTRGLNRTHSYA